MSPPPSANQPPPEESRQLERFVDDFEEAWQNGTAPPIEQFLSPITADTSQADHTARRELLEELVKIDLEYRWRRARAGRDSTGLNEARKQASPDSFPI